MAAVFINLDSSLGFVRFVRTAHVPAQPINSRKTDGRFGSEQVQIRPDLILQQLPKIEITEFA